MMDALIPSIRRRLKALLLGPGSAVPDPYHHPQITVGRHSYGLTPLSIDLFSKDDRIRIGNFCSISRSARFVGGGEHHTTRVSTFPFYTRLLDREPERDLRPSREILVGHDVWIGAYAVIMSGATIGNGAVVGAGSLVTGVVPDYAVVGGVPAKVIRFRFDEAQREALSRIAWWDWSDEKIKDHVNLFYSDPAAFIQANEGPGR